MTDEVALASATIPRIPPYTSEIDWALLQGGGDANHMASYPVGRTQNGSNLCGVFAKGLQGLSASSRDPSHDRDESFIYV